MAKHSIKILLVILAFMLQGCWSVHVVSKKETGNKRTAQLSINAYELSGLKRNSGSKAIKMTKVAEQQAPQSLKVPFKQGSDKTYLTIQHNLNQRDVLFLKQTVQYYTIEHCVVDCPLFYRSNPWSFNDRFDLTLGIRMRF